MKTFARLDPHLLLLGLRVATHLDDLARLDATQHRDQSALTLLLGRHAQRHFFLAFLAVVQIPV
jgi:hypothetical protein